MWEGSEKHISCFPHFTLWEQGSFKREGAYPSYKNKGRRFTRDDSELLSNGWLTFIIGVILVINAFMEQSFTLFLIFKLNGTFGRVLCHCILSISEIIFFLFPLSSHFSSFVPDSIIIVRRKRASLLSRLDFSRGYENCK